MTGDLLRYDEAAAVLKVSRSTIVRWVRPGPDGSPPKLRAYKIGGRVVRIRRADLEALLDPTRRPGEERS